MQKLKPKQEAFALAFVETGNASEAYRRCYDVSVETKPNTIHVKACELLANEKVAAYVGELQAEHRQRHALTVDRIVAELSEVAFAEIRVNARARNQYYQFVLRLPEFEESCLGEHPATRFVHHDQFLSQNSRRFP